MNTSDIARALKSVDLTYLKQGLFTSFMPHSKAGEDAWREIAKHTDGTGKVFTAQLPSFLREIRKAGYSVTEQKKRSNAELEKDLKEIMASLENY
jgi:hypothetical protein